LVFTFQFHYIVVLIGVLCLFFKLFFNKTNDFHAYVMIALHFILDAMLLSLIFMAHKLRSIRTSPPVTHIAARHRLVQWLMPHTAHVLLRIETPTARNTRKLDVILTACAARIGLDRP